MSSIRVVILFQKMRMMKGNMNIETVPQATFPSVSYQVPTPMGMLYIVIVEDGDNKPIAFQLFIGKPGAEIQALTQTMARLMTIVLDRGGTVNDLIQEMSNHTSDHSRSVGNGNTIRSVPDAVVYALMQYRSGKFQETREKLGIVENDDRTRGPRLGH